MENSDFVSFARRLAEILKSDSRGIVSKLEKNDRCNVFRCKIKGNTAVQFDLSLNDISGGVEYHVLNRKDPDLPAKTYRLTIKNAATEKGVSVTNRDKEKANQNAELFDSFEQLFNAIKHASEKNLNSDLDAIIRS